MSVEALIGKQNPDGGWPYRRGASWAEPTVYAVLSLLDGGQSAPAARGIAWLKSLERSDGGWPPCAQVDESCWTTALVALIPQDALGEGAHRRAINWLVGATGEESTFLHPLREWLLGHSEQAAARAPGWPWVPGSAAWVGPTSLAILALDRENRQHPSAAAAARVEQGRRFLLDRMCRGGGWNHGGSDPLGYSPAPYPETTGMALAGLRGCREPRVERSIGLARAYLDTCRSADAMNWLRLGMLAQQQLPAGFAAPAGIEYRTVPEIALNLLATAAGQGRNVFWA